MKLKKSTDDELTRHACCSDPSIKNDEADATLSASREFKGGETINGDEIEMAKKIDVGSSGVIIVLDVSCIEMFAWSRMSHIAEHTS